MALQNCHECEGKVSSEAATCPHCGAPVKKNITQPSQERIEEIENREEETIYKKGAVHVTSTRVIIQGTTYALRNITSVKRKRVESDHKAPLFFVVCGLALIFISITSCNSGADKKIIINQVVLGLLSLIGGGFWASKLRPKFFLVLTTSSGEVQALESNKSTPISEAKDAINLAISQYR